MGLISNYQDLAKNERRRIALDLVEAGLTAIKPEIALKESFKLDDEKLMVTDKEFDLSQYRRIFLIGFGKGSAKISQIVEGTLGDRLTEGFDIDTVEQKFNRIQFTLGTHPLPSEQNISYTKNVLEKIVGLDEHDLVLVVICGGGSAMFESPVKADLGKLTAISKTLLNSGARIDEMNVIRKHLSLVKGGGLAKHLYPATVVSLIFSDVPGNNLSVIASGPTSKDSSSLSDVHAILAKYQIDSKLVPDELLTDLPQDTRYFEKVHNIIMLSNMTVLRAMEEAAKKLGKNAFIFSDRVQGEAKELGMKLINETPVGKILLAGGESTVKVGGNGKGGRNQELVLAALAYVDDNAIIVSFDSDGVDFYKYAGALGDAETVKKASKMTLDRQKFLDNNDSSGFFDQTGDGILTGKLESNVSDIMMVLKI